MHIGNLDFGRPALLSAPRESHARARALGRLPEPPSALLTPRSSSHPSRRPCAHRTACTEDAPTVTNTMTTVLRSTLTVLRRPDDIKSTHESLLTTVHQRQQPSAISVLVIVPALIVPSLRKDLTNHFTSCGGWTSCILSQLCSSTSFSHMAYLCLTTDEPQPESEPEVSDRITK